MKGREGQGGGVGMNIHFFSIFLLHLTYLIPAKKKNNLTLPHLHLHLRSNPPASNPPTNPKTLKHRARKPNRHRFSLGVIRQRRLAQLAPDAALLVAAKGQRVLQHIVLVDPDGAGAEGGGDADGGVEVLGVDGGGEAVGGDITEADGVGLVGELGDGADRAEDLLLHDLHVFAHVGKDGRLDEVAFFAVAFAADFDLGAGFFAGVDVAV